MLVDHGFHPSGLLHGGLLLIFLHLDVGGHGGLHDGLYGPDSGVISWRRAKQPQCIVGGDVWCHVGAVKTKGPTPGVKNPAGPEP